ncbi:helix-turn-helix transcriptional regulator [uncultured Neglectibacter sp.]|uniref:helix-turn-helix transcriptional regulator n=1 Tax=uncultured Neglectibacter sp. TaxID=1924108 RepID=UPI0034DED58E
MVIQTDNRIKRLRTARGLTQTDLAKIMSVTRSSVNAWEMGISVPTAPKLVELALFFHVSTDYLLGLEQREVIELDSLTEDQKAILYSLLTYFQKQNSSE